MQASPPSLTRDDWQVLALPEQGCPVHVLRLDRSGGAAPGNKAFKLHPLLAAAVAGGARCVMSFGGPWSNHLHALAAAGGLRGLETVGLVRGENLATPTLEEAARQGMRLHALAYSAYRRRNDDAFQREMVSRYGPGVLIPEGGDCPAGAGGCLPIGEAIARRFPSGAVVVLATGTGTTLAGITAGLDERFRVIGISALKGALDTAARVQANLDALRASRVARWEIRHDYHCGGFARCNDALQACIHWSDSMGLPLEPVYTGKALLAVRQMLAAGQLDTTLDTTLPLVLVHTGGLQGRRGFAWLGPSA
ncbi:pyridoxal-phosphate dependent enzyme [Parahaliea maris]|uniref:Pyridoxal-phosphate dependent enzyme n=1 Tax=Parahaliea maris TaxID=2716870 RepID=A0A5C8ZYH9_9GAMM|nr:pyridoxal-phosphate dependent enzyme [Parahaliea maris]TXS92784.1 pyridoxal-phosphate dependent enzyme [Parahaliea maris]